MEKHFDKADKVINDIQEVTNRIKDILDTIPVKKDE